MESVLAFVVGAMVAASVYLMLRRRLLNFLFGLVLISNAVNLLIFASGRLTRGRPALIPEDAGGAAQVLANALSQALILTAIVIGFGLMAFVLVLIYRAYRVFDTIDAEAMREAEPPEDEPGTDAHRPESRQAA